MDNLQRSSFGRSLSLTGRLLRTQLWLYPIAAALLLAGLGWWLQRTVERSLEENVAADLQVVLGADIEALEIWLTAQRRNAEMAARDPRVAEPIAALLTRGADPEATPASLTAAPEQEALANALEPWLTTYDYGGWMLATPQQLVVAAMREELVGREVPRAYSEYMDKALEGKTLVTRPSPSAVLLPDRDGQLRAGVPTMFVVTPVRDASQRIIGLLGLRIAPEGEFSKILNVAQEGVSDEAYAFDKQGRMLTASRFDEQLKEIGLLPDRAEASSALTLELRDPGADLTLGRRATARQSERPLTLPVAEAIAGRDGLAVAPYRDYRGVPTVGAWKWLPEYQFGVVAEIDAADAYRPVTILRRVFWALFALLAAAALVVFLFTLWANRLRAAARRASLEARQLGQYALEEKIGEGGMGVVYRGRHAMMQRPTAVKLLDPQRTTEAAVARFEREVRLSCQLNHPNTIAIYDYGRTPEGVFYYAMELLDGVDLEALVERDGPQPEGRVVPILRQVCGSLQEAHALGLIHRDIKPANIMVNFRGGQFDVVKLLDFGLVKAVDARKESTLTAAGSLTGTPMYLSPEAIEDPERVDARSDLYAVGAVGYFLLSGQPVFDGASVVEICMKHVNQPPPSLASRGVVVSDELEALILSCLEKNPALRPQSAAEIIDRLDACPVAPWTRRDAADWWRQAGRAVGPSQGAPATLSRGPDATLARDASVVESDPQRP